MYFIFSTRDRKNTGLKQITIISDFAISVLSLLEEKKIQVATLNVPLNFFLNKPKGSFLGKATLIAGHANLCIRETSFRRADTQHWYVM